MKKYLPFIWILLLSIVTIQLEKPTKVKPADTQGFSAINAMQHLEVMASETHFMGTEQNDKVRDYILDEFEKLNISTEIFIGHSKHSWGAGYARIGRTENIIATIKGQSSGKAVMVVGHYDSVLSSPGAADDTHSVACILEIARLLKKENHENDIIFLITDGEEMGLFGAKAFTEMRDVSNIGLVLNYEARGNSGPSISFEWSEGNAWLVKQLRKAGNRPMANSMSFEIYKNLPNDTDFTFFKEAGLTGINNAFIDGFSYYHNPADTPEAINQNSVQHTGENMYLLTRHFANTDISNTKTNNASFFNLLGGLIIYPSSWDIILLILALALVGFVVYKSTRSQKIPPKSILIAFVYVLGLMTIAILTGLGLGKLLINLYPHYQGDVFYAGQFYNHKYYLLTSIGLVVTLSWITVYLQSKRGDTDALKSATLIILALLAIGIYVYAPTASYFMIFPLLALCVAYLIDLRGQDNQLSGLSSYALSTIGLGLWIPVLTTIFLAFSLIGLPGPALLVVFICLASLILFKHIWTDSRLLLYGGLITIAISLLMGHLTSAPTPDQPLPSSLFYNYDVTTGEAHLATDDNRVNLGNKGALGDASKIELQLPHKRSHWAVTTDVQPHVPIPQVVRDSADTNHLEVISTSEVYLTRLYLNKTDNVSEIYINGHAMMDSRDSDGSFLIDAYAMRADTLDIRVDRPDDTEPLAIGINSHFLSLPMDEELPDNVLRTDGFTGIVQRIEL